MLNLWVPVWGLVLGRVPRSWITKMRPFRGHTALQNKVRASRERRRAVHKGRTRVRFSPCGNVNKSVFLNFIIKIVIVICVDSFFAYLKYVLEQTVFLKTLEAVHLDREVIQFAKRA